jgi:HPt (histidine-containing phosphotransfer) domain-containing protein/virulence-associated protein VagC
MLNHHDSFEADELEEDLSWLAEFDSVTPQPGEDIKEHADQAVGDVEGNLEWLTEGEEFSFEAFDEPVELSDDVDWLTVSPTEQQTDSFELFESQVVPETHQNESATEANDTSLESLLAELEGIGVAEQPENLLFELEEEITEATPNSSAVMPEYQPFNEAAVLTMSGEDIEIAKEILDTFLENYATDIQELMNAYESKDLSWLKDVSHRIKGSALYLGSDSISQVAKDLEKSSASGSDELAQERVEFIAQKLQQLANEIENYCETLTA